MGATVNLSQDEREARDQAFKAGRGVTPREGDIWNEAWAAARAYYAAGADEANALRERLGLVPAHHDQGEEA